MASVLNSLPTLWMLYLVLSLIVLIMGWLGTRWLPRTLQWVLVGIVAGVCWMPWSFHETATVTDDSFSGVAPAVIVAMMDVMRHRASTALLVVLLAAIIGGAVGVLFGAWRARHASGDDQDSSGSAHAEPQRRERREPTL
ncbi:hypothetical protein [Zymobacter palmae]|uniref:Uncharacterized protein n=1 Tax=Zymobacter palmae TaxID=33074 RepID=A0A348HCS6_9GAMM|nr:hypothetical protein [Zymobacter palmae]BBG29428.1 hypothetical protein ZBT109_0650 [Zymobacter palmae]